MSKQIKFRQFSNRLVGTPEAKQLLKDRVVFFSSNPSPANGAPNAG